ncbi:MAG: flagellar biosynthetic protein FliR [Pirellula sp.]
MTGLASLGLESVLWCYICVGMRLGPILMTLPPFASFGVSWFNRALLISIVCLSVTPILGFDHAMVPQTIGVGIGVLASELAFGAAIAVSIHFFLAAFQTVGSMLAEMVGLSLEGAEAETPTGNHVQRILVWSVTSLFVLSGSHRWALQLVMDSFDQIAVGSQIDVVELFYQVPMRFGHALSIALRLSLPAATVLFLIGIAKFWILRSLKAWDNLAVAAPLVALGLVWSMLLSLSAIGWLYQHEIAAWMDQTQRSVLESQRWSSSNDLQTFGKPTVGADG